MLDKTDLSRRSDLEAECMFPLPDRVRFATGDGPIARGSSNAERIVICNKDCSWPLTEATFQYHALWAWIFIRFWEKAHGQIPRHLVFDSKLTTQANLARLDRMKIDFITLRRRSPARLCEVYGLPRSAWRTIELDVPSRQYQTPRVYEQPVTLCGRRFRQLFVLDLGHDKPTILLTNQSASAPKLITRYARRMLIENSLSDAVRFFHMDALSSAVGLKVDFDMALLVIASGLYRLLARQMRGYAEAQARQIFRDLLDLPAQVEITEQEVRVEFHRRAHLPIVLASGLCDKPVTVPWWPKRRLRLTTYTGR